MIGRRAALATVVALAALWLVPHRDLQFSATLGVLLVASTAWLLVVREVVRGAYRPTFREALALAVAARAVVLALDPALSDDVWRYLFEGQLVLEGVNPYLHAPSDAALAGLRNPSWELVNNPEIPAAYPPAVQLALAAGVALGGGAPLGVKLVFGAFDLATFVLLWRLLPAIGRRAPLALVHGLCPLVVHEFTVEGHSDSLAICAVVAAVLAAHSARPLAAGVALGVATAGKLMPVVLLPFVARSVHSRPWLVVVGCAATVAALWAPFVADEMFAGTFEYATRWRSNDSAFASIWMATDWLHGLGLFGGYEVQRVSKVPLLVLGLVVLGVAWRRHLPPERAALWFFAFFVAFAPTVHPWYVGFLVPFLCLAPSPGLLVFTGSALLAYHVVPEWIVLRRWEERWWVKAVEYAPFYAGLAAMQMKWFTRIAPTGPPRS